MRLYIFSLACILSLLFTDASGQDTYENKIKNIYNYIFADRQPDQSTIQQNQKAKIDSALIVNICPFFVEIDYSCFFEMDSVKQAMPDLPKNTKYNGRLSHRIQLTDTSKLVKDGILTRSGPRSMCVLSIAPIMGNYVVCELKCRPPRGVYPPDKTLWVFKFDGDTIVKSFNIFIAY